MSFINGLKNITVVCILRQISGTNIFEVMHFNLGLCFSQFQLIQLIAFNLIYVQLHVHEHLILILHLIVLKYIYIFPQNVLCTKSVQNVQNVHI